MCYRAESVDSVFVQVILVAAVAGFIQGISGFAFALVATSLWAWTLEPKLLVPTVVVTSLLGQAISILNVKAEVKLARASPFLIGGAIGVPAGAMVLPMLNVEVFRFGIGIILVIYCSIMLGRTHLPLIRGGGRVADSCVGLISGVMGGATGIAGPPMILWCALRGWDKDIQRATFQAYFIGVQILTIVIYVATGLINATSMHLLLIAALPIIISSWLGSRVFKRFSNQYFQKVIIGLLLLSGFTLFLSGLSRLWVG
ncbi:MAG: sulfite exporter TauE/SafE family protein [Rhodocyclaceae bacterium]|nr:MAG: sulfite exporter TauE/SafE family protein [Rhodocyclaceae bacterium]